MRRAGFARVAVLAMALVACSSGSGPSSQAAGSASNSLPMPPTPATSIAAPIGTAEHSPVTPSTALVGARSTPCLPHAVRYEGDTRYECIDGVFVEFAVTAAPTTATDVSPATTEPPRPSTTSPATSVPTQLPSTVADSVRQCVADASAATLISDGIASHDATRIREARLGCSIARQEVAESGVRSREADLLTSQLDLRALKLIIIENLVALRYQRSGAYDEYEASRGEWADRTTELVDSLT